MTPARGTPASPARRQGGVVVRPLPAGGCAGATRRRCWRHMVLVPHGRGPDAAGTCRGRAFTPGPSRLVALEPVPGRSPVSPRRLSRVPPPGTVRHWHVPGPARAVTQPRGLLPGGSPPPAPSRLFLPQSRRVAEGCLGPPLCRHPGAGGGSPGPTADSHPPAPFPPLPQVRRGSGPGTDGDAAGPSVGGPPGTPPPPSAGARRGSWRCDFFTVSPKITLPGISNGRQPPPPDTRTPGGGWWGGQGGRGGLGAVGQGLAHL